MKISKSAIYTSYVLQGLIVLMFLMGSVSNISQSQTAVDMATEMGYPASSVMYLGVVLLISTLLYAFPKTSVIGAILLTAWLGGAVATHIIHGDPASSIFIPVVFGIIIWFCIWLRDLRVRNLFQ